MKTGVKDPEDAELYEYAREIFEDTVSQFTTSEYTWSFSTPQLLS